VFVEYADTRREALWELVSLILSWLVIFLSAFILIVEFFPLEVATLLSSGASLETRTLAASLLRISVPAVVFLSLSGVLTGVLLALKRFTLPAFTTAMFNAGIVITTLAFQQWFGVQAMAGGLLIGAIAQVLLLFPGLHDSKLRFRFDFRHPGLRRIVLLYAPIAVGLMVDIFISRPISYNLASLTGEGGISWMGYATTLRELPQGLVAVAVSFAILPLLSAHASAESQTVNSDEFKSTLARGLRLVVVLIIPATVGLFVLAQPIVRLMFEHGDFVARDTQITTEALKYYLLGLPFAGVDLLLVFAFFARQDTLIPSLIGIASHVVYLLLAVALLPTMGLFSLMIADSFKQFFHALLCALILQRRIGLIQGGLFRTVLFTMIASAAMAGVTWGLWQGIVSLMPTASTLANLFSVLVAGMAGAVAYALLITWFGIEEIHILRQAIMRKLGK
jgi:putative peptidoglycan lipid II flippase